MIFKRKVYSKLKEWKEKYSREYAVLLEGPRRVGKSTIVEEFAKNEYKSYILVDFSMISKEQISCFDDINNLTLFFLRLQTVYQVTLYERKSAIIFDEIQLFPKARQAIKHLVKDGRYDYIETGSLISIKKNVEGILIPSEEMKIEVNPLDYEEFCLALGLNYDNLKKLYDLGVQVGQINRTLMRNLRLYMAVGGMPQAVLAYVNNKNFEQIDNVKRQIIKLYEDDFNKIDSSGKVSALFHSIPSQLSNNVKRYRISTALNKKKTDNDSKKLYELINSKTVLASYNVFDPSPTLSSTKDLDTYKMYLADTGLFVTLMFIDRSSVDNTLYAKLLSDKLPANLGYLYENLVAQMIHSTGKKLFYHTWEKEKSTHYFKIDFLISINNKLRAIEVKSSGVGKCESLEEFQKKYSKHILDSIVLSQKDVSQKENIRYLPFYFTPFLIE